MIKKYKDNSNDFNNIYLFTEKVKDKDFFIVLDKRYYLKSFKDLKLFFKSSKSIYFYEEDGEVKALMLISEYKGKNYIKILSYNFYYAKNLFKCFCWNENYKELYAFFNSKNRYNYLLENFNFKKIKEDKYTKLYKGSSFSIQKEMELTKHE